MNTETKPRNAAGRARFQIELSLFMLHAGREEESRTAMQKGLDILEELEKTIDGIKLALGDEQ